MKRAGAIMLMHQMLVIWVRSICFSFFVLTFLLEKMASYEVPSIEIQLDGSIVIREGFTSISTPEIREPIQKHGAKLAKSHIFNVEEVRKDGITEIRGRCLHETAICEPLTL